MWTISHEISKLVYWEKNKKKKKNLKVSSAVTGALRVIIQSDGWQKVLMWKTTVQMLDFVCIN